MMTKYLSLVDYKACEYNFMTLYMWQHIYNTHVAECNGTMYVIGKDEKGYFSTVPISIKKRWHHDLRELEDLFHNVFNEKIVIRAVPKEYAQFINQVYPEKFNIIADIDAYDYLYDAEKLRTLSGRAMHSKKNHYNGFIKEYGDRYQYKRLKTEEEFEEALEVMEKWAQSKDLDEYIITERNAMEKIFHHSKLREDTKVGGIYIDGKLEAFTFADYLTEDTIDVHLEKANPDIRGLYAAINKIFLEKEYPDVKYVNREDDMGLEGLRKAKQSYKPIAMVEKYIIREK